MVLRSKCVSKQLLTAKQNAGQLSCQSKTYRDQTSFLSHLIFTSTKTRDRVQERDPQEHDARLLARQLRA